MDMPSIALLDERESLAIAAHINLPARYLDSVTNAEGFTQSRRFLRYKDDIKSKIAEYLSKTYGIVREDEDGITQMSRKAKQNFLVYPTYFKTGLKNRFRCMIRYLKHEERDEGDRYSLLDVTNTPHRFHYSILWESECIMYDILSAGEHGELYDDLPIDCLENYIEGNQPSTVISLDDLMEKEFTELCLETIRAIEMIEDINDANWYRRCQLETDLEVFNFMKDYASNLHICVENAVKTMVDILREQQATGERPLQMQNAALLLDNMKLQEKMDKLEGEYSKKIESEKLKNAQLERQVAVVKEECNKQYKSQLHDAQKLSKKSKDEFEKLDHKYQSALERIKLLEDLLAEHESKEIGTEEISYDPDFFKRRFIFARNKSASGYTIMKELADRFPNATFTNGIANDFDPKTTDGVVLLTRFEKHGLYWGIRDACKNLGIPYVHCDASNLERICATMYHTFMSENNSERNSYKCEKN